MRLALALLLLSLTACSSRDPVLFELLTPAESGVDFVNHVVDTPELNILNYLYFYDGGGVAVGDVNGDDLPDVYFVANGGPNRLYLNRGGLRFEDVTETAGVAGSSDWDTGVTMADVNGDGLLDIYVSAVSGHEGLEGRNELFINNGDLTFSEQAASYGLDFQGFSTQAAFFDYDLDGDLDMYLLNHSTHEEETRGTADARYERNPQAGDRLYRNDDGRFADVSEQAGIHGGPTGYGLGLVVSDLNDDGRPDVYVANDFHENDYLYVNNGDGTFRDDVYRATGHNSRSSMGADAADFNNDGLIDVVVLDMLPERQDILHTSYSIETSDVESQKLSQGFHHQYKRNTLFLNRGEGRFSEIGLLAGIEATDWSWAPLFCDLDNDGWKDLVVTNGIWRRPNDRQYLQKAYSPAVQASLREIDEEDLDLLEDMPHVRIPNYAFRNNGNLTFENRARAWGLRQELFSNGAAYADLDNDGDLDLVFNNLNDPASIYENRGSGGGYLSIRLRGPAGNSWGVGARVILRTGSGIQVQELMPTRGFQSSVDPHLHFGLGSDTTIAGLTVIWPGGRRQSLTGVPANRRIELRYDEAAEPGDLTPAPDGFFADVTESLSVPYRHHENDFSDFTREPFMPHKVSREGPALAVSDVNEDGLDDLFAGGAKWQPASLLLQTPSGNFESSNEDVWRADSLHEDVDAAFFDADGDGDLDLYVVSGGNEWMGEAPALRDRLYENDGTGRFSRRELPDLFTNGSVVRPADFDADGDVDLFIGGRVVTGSYGESPRSYLLRNDGGRFVDDTPPLLREPGMVTDAAWFDADGDGTLDLAVAAEWMPVRVFRQESDGFTEDVVDGGHGWWSAIHAADLNSDGATDLILGNMGLNSRLKASRKEPVRLFRGDFDANGSADLLLTSFNHGKSYAFAGRDELINAFPTLARKYPTYASYGEGRAEDVLSEVDDASVLEADVFRSAIALNDGRGGFTLRDMPLQAQFAPVRAILSMDVDGDRAVDIVLGGNFSGVTPARGRYDASYGTWIKTDGRGAFSSIEPRRSGLWLEGEIRALRLLRHASGKRVLVAARNDDRLQFLRLQ